MGVQNTYYYESLMVLGIATMAIAEGLDYKKLDQQMCCIKITTIVRQNCQYLFEQFICFYLNQAWDAVK